MLPAWKCSASCWTTAEAGDNIGALLRGVQRNEIERGQVLAKPGSIHPHTHFIGQVYVLTKEEGGRHTPFFNGYRPQFYFRTTDVTGNIKLPDGVEMVMPGDNIDMEITLITPIAMRAGPAFRYPRRRPHRWLRRCCQGDRVISRAVPHPPSGGWGARRSFPGRPSRRADNH